MNDVDSLRLLLLPEPLQRGPSVRCPLGLSRRLADLQPAATGRQSLGLQAHGPGLGASDRRFPLVSTPFSLSDAHSRAVSSAFRPLSGAAPLPSDDLVGPGGAAEPSAAALLLCLQRLAGISAGSRASLGQLEAETYRKNSRKPSKTHESPRFSGRLRLFGLLRELFLLRLRLPVPALCPVAASRGDCAPRSSGLVVINSGFSW